MSAEAPGWVERLASEWEYSAFLVHALIKIADLYLRPPEIVDFDAFYLSCVVWLFNVVPKPIR